MLKMMQNDIKLLGNLMKDFFFIFYFIISFFIKSLINVEWPSKFLNYSVYGFQLSNMWSNWW